MKVFVLAGCDAYEMREVLGVYKSLEGAREQAARVAAESLGGFGFYEISVNDLDEDAVLMYVVETLNEQGELGTVL